MLPPNSDWMAAPRLPTMRWPGSSKAVVMRRVSMAMAATSVAGWPDCAALANDALTGGRALPFPRRLCISPHSCAPTATADENGHAQPSHEAPYNSLKESENAQDEDEERRQEALQAHGYREGRHVPLPAPPPAA